jgi:hypothetical protein
VKIVKRVLLFILLVLFIIIASPLLFPLLISGVIVTWVKASQIKKQYQAFLSRNNDLVFFCYSDRKRNQVFVQQKILPHLDPAIYTIFIQGNEPQSDFDKRSVARMLDNVKHKSCPMLLHIANGQVFETTLEDDLQQVIDGHIDPTQFAKIVTSKVQTLRQQIVS